MSRPRRRRMSRTARIRLSLGVTAAGAALVTVGAILVERSRDTDLADAREGVTSRLSHAIPDDAPKLLFTDVTGAFGIDAHHGDAPRARLLPEDTGSGLAWGDIDADGDPDLYIVTLSHDLGGSGNRLYRNDGGTFTDITESAGVEDADGMGMAASFADFDADGDVDLYVTNDGPNRLYRNRGDGTFEDVAEAAGVAGDSWSVGIAWADFDGDGHLDLHVCNYVLYDDLDDSMFGTGDMGGYVAPPALNPKVFEPVTNRLYRNLGDGTFTDVAAELGVDDPRGRSLAATLCDLDGDGLLDLYVNNDVSPNRLYLARRADGVTTFEDQSAATGTADPRGSMGLSVGDVTGPGGLPDGLPDLFITHWIAQENALYEGFVAPSGALVYRDKARVMRVAELSTACVGWGCAFVDLDLDGRTDLAVINGSTLEDGPNLAPQAPFVLWNDGRRFHDLSPVVGAPLDGELSARGLAAADFDGDGDIDLAISQNRGRALLLRNDLETTNRALRIDLDVPDATRFGARVTVVNGERRQTQWAGCDVSFASQHGASLVFGLGESDAADQVIVTFADGRETTTENVPAGRVRIGADGPR